MVAPTLADAILQSEKKRLHMDLALQKPKQDSYHNFLKSSYAKHLISCRQPLLGRAATLYKSQYKYDEIRNLSLKKRRQ